jgi:hypothetical protein
MNQGVQKSFLKFSNLIFAFCDYLLFEKYLTLYLNNFEFLLPKNVLYQI